MHSINIYKNRNRYAMEGLDHFIDAAFELQLSRVSNDLYAIGLNDEDVQEAVRRAMNTCISLGLPIRRHFKQVYLCGDNMISKSWKLSERAFKLVVINANTTNPNVAKFQTDLITKIS